jgi:glycosyltransferase involved in cell wall biosynthesis
MNQHKIAFIICANNALYYDECVRYINDLNIPEGLCTDIICIQEADSMTQGYNAGMQASDAKYKVYLHQDTFILNRNFIKDMLQVFSSDISIGLLGVLGIPQLPSDVNCHLCKKVGNIIKYDGHTIMDTDFLLQRQDQNWQEVEAIDGLLMATQYDIPWREDFLDGWDFYDISQSLEMKRHGYKVVVPYQKETWCYHNCGCPNLQKYDYYRKKMLLEYPEVFNGTVDWEIVRHEVENAQKIEDLKNEMLKLLTQHQYKTLIESAEKAREKNFLNTELREISNLMEIYGLEKTNIRPIHSEWFEYTDWLQIKEYYNWVRFVVLRIEYGYEDERIAEIKELIKNGRVSRDAIRKISAVSLKDTYKVYEQLLKEEWEEPLVSVIIPVHNAEDVIENTLDSVLNQSYQNMEVIIVDDASTDSSREKIEAYEDSRLKKIFLETNHHVCYSGNIGFENATGKYIALIGHDDCWRADKLEKQISFLEEHPSYGLTFTWVNIIDENGENKNVENDIFYKTFRNDNFKKEYWNRRLIVKGNSFCAPSACIRSDILKRTGIYRYALVQLQDYDLWLRILRETEVYTIQEKLTYYRRFTQAGKNVSDMNEKAKARDYHEKQWIQETYVKNLSSEEFTQIFNDDMKNKNVCDEKEILCEKAFFLWNMGNCFAEKWFIELLEDMECQKILEEKYNFKLTDFYEMNTEPMLFDQTIVGIVKQQQLIIRNYANEE